ncbi:hypothetical protein BB560_002585 [Smittium megazygosporum]|uniref:HMG box domain-containing protein n=1 Tax=Smittium megazygosporum TaxID=133381 RepID=A0A2T9ZEC4_9FUNG|nr:hypothetical protein BB560_002585 [Smittium megazygosporum]
MEVSKRVFAYKPNEITVEDGTRYIETSSNHYMIFIPNTINRHDIARRLLNTRCSGESKKGQARANRAHNSFILYRMDKTKQIIQRNPSINQKVVSKMIASMWKSERIEVKKKYKAKSEELKNRINNHNRIAKESVSTNMYLKLQVDDNLEKNSKKVDSATQSLVENSTVLPSEPCINEWVQGLSSSNAPNQYNQPIDYSRLSGTNVQQPHSGNTCVVTEQAEILDDEDIKLKNFHKEQSSKHRRTLKIAKFNKPSVLSTDASSYFCDSNNETSTSFGVSETLPQARKKDIVFHRACERNFLILLSNMNSLELMPIPYFIGRSGSGRCWLDSWLLQNLFVAVPDILLSSKYYNGKFFVAFISGYIRSLTHKQCLYTRIIPKRQNSRPMFNSLLKTMTQSGIFWYDHIKFDSNNPSNFEFCLSCL